MVCDDFTIYQRKPEEFGFICLRREDDYKSIWLSLSGVDVDKPVDFVKTNGDRLFDVDFYDRLVEVIGHESLHSVIGKLENWDVSKSYDNLYHGKGAWWLP